MVRIANPKDIDQINILGIIVNKDFLKQFNVDNILKEPFNKIFVYEDGDKILGFIHLVELVDNIDIINIVVDENYQRKGIASSLLDHIFNSYNNKVVSYTLEVAINNDKAINLYKKFAFNIVGIRKQYYNDIDAYIMRKEV